MQKLANGCFRSQTSRLREGCQVLDQGRPGILAIRPCNTSCCKFHCNMCCKCCRRWSAETRLQKWGRTFLHSWHPDNDMNHPTWSQNNPRSNWIYCWNGLCKEALLVVDAFYPMCFSQITHSKMSDVWGDLGGSVECVTAVKWCNFEGSRLLGRRKRGPEGELARAAG